LEDRETRVIWLVSNGAHSYDDRFSNVGIQALFVRTEALNMRVLV
jgi:hypothetical protein